ncbi:hypothetical protein [Spirochaeta thermophila]|uniref:Uncharacterized protein n=1 Tax=Winmispira thermophila (strain ATCC 49972 / DSM 6192 / RI 19.B1) TaxID=665571 RepID=E0RPH7_WINT6|nr:hypothetical protein [Spirochaeta thermophila]ADN02759.1 hypothetical protein STHERM_c18240 [Spirochaeta thermophila DSM 6192]
MNEKEWLSMSERYDRMREGNETPLEHPALQTYGRLSAFLSSWVIGREEVEEAAARVYRRVEAALSAPRRVAGIALPVPVFALLVVFALAGAGFSLGVILGMWGGQAGMDVVQQAVVPLPSAQPGGEMVRALGDSSQDELVIELPPVPSPRVYGTPVFVRLSSGR